ncbi:unnamed protein product [Soboliphyme baturini]|uniref:Secreted protein n=1 Tax=Soboliphyme baturini TaxID=241478 RepID=A0A183J114_9BILA|nr:unnamed protein product [Soboliphyme baturini]
MLLIRTSLGSFAGSLGHAYRPCFVPVNSATTPAIPTVDVVVFDRLLFQRLSEDLNLSTVIIAQCLDDRSADRRDKLCQSFERSPTCVLLLVV